MAIEASGERLIFGHKPGLFVLFGTEMWERFSFYGMKALLLFYLTKYHLFGDEQGNLLVGSYAALVYAFPVIGGYLADKYLGFRKAVIFGGILLVLGHMGMAYEGNAATMDAAGVISRDQKSLQIFYFSLAFIIVGVGFLKANISSIVGNLYDVDDEKRDAGFTIFYMGINLGSFLATLICGWLGENYGWNYGFGVAGIGMLLGLITFISGQKYLTGLAEPPNPSFLKEKFGGLLSYEWLIYGAGLLGVIVSWSMVQHHTVVELMLKLAGAACLVRIAYFMFFKCSPVERDRLLVLTVLIVFSVVFWALFEQSYTSLNLFADRVLHRTIGGFEIPASWFLSLNALFIILFAPLFAWLWVWLEKRNANPNAALKFAIAIIFVSLGFGILVVGSNFSVDGRVHLIWLAAAYLLHTFGELCLSPVGLSSVTKLAPAKIVGFMMGVWFLATAASEYIAGLLANIASVDTSGGNVIDPIAALSSYSGLFYTLFKMGLIFGAILLVASPFLKRLMHGVK